jgi:Raf kinase inhibitor-like YbhB/YbcL family protein
MFKSTFILMCFLASSNVFAMTIKSKDFVNEGKIPPVFTCDGKNISPELSWSDVPAKAQSLALIAHDPDAPHEGGWTHWVLFNLPVTTKGLPQAMKEYPKGAVRGLNSSQKNQYHGPCPPTGSHRYYFRLYALDTKLDLPEGANKDKVEQAMKGHVLGQAELMGKYEKIKG